LATKNYLKFIGRTLSEHCPPLATRVNRASILNEGSTPLRAK
jgi:hypothetical protein